MKTIRVTGTAKLRLPPDVTAVTMTLQGTEPDYSAALSRASREADTLRAALERLDFKPEELKTISFFVNTEYESFEESGVWKQRLAGYRFEHVLKLSFDLDHERLGAVLAALEGSAANPVLQISHALKNPGAAKKTLLKQAVADAREKAEILSAASGTVLKDVQSIDHTAGEPDFTPRVMHRLDAPEAAKAALDLHLEPEALEVSDAVTVLWEMA